MSENVYRDTDHRYLNDPDFRALVTTLEAAAERHGFTPGELKQAAFKAALNIEEKRFPMRMLKRKGIEFVDLQPGEVPVPPPETIPAVKCKLVIGLPQPLPSNVRTFHSWKEVCEAYGWTYGPAERAEDEAARNAPLPMVIPLVSIPERPPCTRCGQDVPKLGAYQNKAGHVFCGRNCYEATEPPTEPVFHQGRDGERSLTPRGAAKRDP